MKDHEGWNPSHQSHRGSLSCSILASTEGWDLGFQAAPYLVIPALLTLYDAMNGSYISLAVPQP